MCIFAILGVIFPLPYLCSRKIIWFQNSSHHCNFPFSNYVENVSFSSLLSYHQINSSDLGSLITHSFILVPSTQMRILFKYLCLEILWLYNKKILLWGEAKEFDFFIPKNSKSYMQWQTQQEIRSPF